MKKHMVNAINYFIDQDTGELNKRGTILAGILFFIILNIVGYIEGGGLFPWE